MFQHPSSTVFSCTCLCPLLVGSGHWEFQLEREEQQLRRWRDAGTRRHIIDMLWNSRIVISWNHHIMKSSYHEIVISWNHHIATSLYRHIVMITIMQDMQSDISIEDDVIDLNNKVRGIIIIIITFTIRIEKYFDFFLCWLCWLAIQISSLIDHEL